MTAESGGQGCAKAQEGEESDYDEGCWILPWGVG